MDVKKFISKWLDSDIKNKIGTGLWAAAGICWLIIAIQWLCFTKKIFDFAGSAGGSIYLLYFIVFLLLLILFVFYAILTVGLLGSINICASIIKTWAILTIFSDIVYLIEFLIANKVMHGMLSSMFKQVGLGSTLVIIIVSQVFTIASLFTVTVTNAPKSRLATLLFCILTGAIGGHLFYVGRNKGAIVRAVLSLTFIASFVSTILTIVDIVLIAIGKFKDADGNLVTEWIPGKNQVLAN